MKKECTPEGSGTQITIESKSQLDELVRLEAQKMLASALEAEAP